MKITVSKDRLGGALRKTINAINSKSTIPILNNLLIEASEEGLFITATDLEICIRTKVEGKVEKPGNTTLPARKLNQIVNALPEGNVVLERNENHQTSISCQRSFFKMPGLDDNEFPREEEITPNWSFSLPCGELKKILSKVSYAVSHDESRYVLNGTLLSVRSGVLTAVATDGRRLALMEWNLNEDGLEDFDIILPAKTVSELLKVFEGDDPVKVDLAENKVVFKTDNILISSKLVEGTYPNYRQVIPAEFNNSAIIQRDDLIEVIGRVAMMISDSSSTVSMKLDNGTMNIRALSSEYGEGSEPLDISYEGESFEISFNPVFIQEPLRHMEADQVVFQFNDEFSPASLSGDEGFLCILMPMRS